MGMISQNNIRVGLLFPSDKFFNTNTITQSIKSGADVSE